MKAEAFDSLGRVLWRTHLVTQVAAVGAAVLIAVARVRHGPSPYFDPVDLYIVPIGASVYLFLANAVACVTHYPDHRAASGNFAILAGVAAMAAIVSLVAWGLFAVDS